MSANLRGPGRGGGGAKSCSQGGCWWKVRGRTAAVHPCHAQQRAAAAHRWLRGSASAARSSARSASRIEKSPHLQGVSVWVSDVRVVGSVSCSTPEVRCGVCGGVWMREQPCESGARRLAAPAMGHGRPTASQPAPRPACRPAAVPTQPAQGQPAGSTHQVRRRSGITRPTYSGWYSRPAGGKGHPVSGRIRGPRQGRAEQGGRSRRLGWGAAARGAPRASLPPRPAQPPPAGAAATCGPASQLSCSHTTASHVQSQAHLDSRAAHAHRARTGAAAAAAWSPPPPSPRPAAAGRPAAGGATLRRPRPRRRRTGPPAARKAASGFGRVRRRSADGAAALPPLQAPSCKGRWRPPGPPPPPPHLHGWQRLAGQQVCCVPQPQAPQLLVGQPAGGEEQERHFGHLQSLHACVRQRRRRQMSAAAGGSVLAPQQGQAAC